MEDYFGTIDLGVLSKILGANGDQEKEKDFKARYQFEWKKIGKKEHGSHGYQRSFTTFVDTKNTIVGNASNCQGNAIICAASPSCLNMQVWVTRL